MNSCILLIPLIDAVIGFLLVFGILVYFVNYRFKKLRLLFKEALSKPEIHKNMIDLISRANLEPLLHQFLDQRLDEFVVIIQQQIPMAGAFLKGTLLEKLKSLGNQEIQKMLPELKKNIGQKIEESMRADSFATQILESLDWKPLVSALRVEMFMLAVCGGILGLTLGFTHMVFMAFYC